jgi:hypothetical protein
MNSKINHLFQPIPNIRYRLWSEAALLAIMIMELSWVTAWYNTTAHPAVGLAVITPVLASGLFISHWLARLMRAHNWRMAFRRAIFLFWLFIYLFISLKVLLYSQVSLSPLELVTQPLRTIFSSQSGDRDFWHFLVLSLLVLRGITLSNAPVDHHRVSGSLQLGLLMYLLFGIANSQSHPLATVAVLFFYLFISLIGLSAAGIADLSDLRGGKLPRFSSGWSLGIVLASLSVVGLAVLLGWIMSGRFVLQMISEFASVIITVLFFLLALVLIPLLLLTQFVLNYLKDFIFRLFDQKIFEDLANFLGKQVNQQQESIQNLLQVNNTLRTIIVVGVLFIAFLAILIALQARPRRRRLVGEETSQIIDESNLKFKFPNILQINVARFSRGRRWLAAAQIRRIYAQLMELCEKLGKARPAAATPLEFLQTLEMLFPGENACLALITQAYLKVRYGELPENPQEVQTVIDAWAHIKSRGRKAWVEKKRLDRLVEKK